MSLSTARHHSTTGSEPPAHPADGRPSLRALSEGIREQAGRTLGADLPDLVPDEDPRLARRRCELAIAALSRHLAAVEHVIHPAARRHLPDGRTRVVVHDRAARDLEMLLRSAEEILNGDAHAGAGGLRDLQEDLRAALGRYGVEEDGLLARLEEALTTDACDALAERLAAASASAPTRPHPFAPRSGLLERAAFHVNAMWDAALDAMDNRQQPPSRRRTIPSPGLWTSYLLGTMTPRSSRETEGPQQAHEGHGLSTGGRPDAPAGAGR